MKPTPYVSVHGGHSGQFCSHATDLLEEIVQLYIEKQFSWVGITEHSPPISEALLDPDPRAAGFTQEILFAQFSDYMQECRRLQKKYADQITIFAAMEIETYSGYESFVPYLLSTFDPDYIVGSVHFVEDIGFDYSKEFYDKAVSKLGGTDNLYCRYFDLQYEMISLLKPAVVGHFDLIRIFDSNYDNRLRRPEIWQRIERNLNLIHERDLILDYNLRSLRKGAKEPYIALPILKLADEMGIAIVPGDDSHGLDSVGNFMDIAIRNLQKLGISTTWQKPKLLSAKL